MGLRYQRGLGVFVGALIALYALTVADPNPVLSAALDHRHGDSDGGRRCVICGSAWRAPLLVAFWAAFVLNAR